MQFLEYAGMEAINVVGWKFKPENQMAFYKIRDPDGEIHELHVHYAGNGIAGITGANIRFFRGKELRNSNELHKSHPVVLQCVAHFEVVDRNTAVFAGDHRDL